MKHKNNFLAWLVLLLLSWRIALFLVAYYAIENIGFKASFPYAEILLEPTGHPIIWSWANFDGVHYLTIAEHGYSAQFTQAFFPLYPLLINLMARFTHNYLATGLFLSHLALFAGLVCFYKLIRLDYPKKTANNILIYLLLFPTSFFFVAYYSESLFFLVSVVSLFFARKKKWWLASIFAAVASATRFIGIFLMPALLIDWYLSRNKKTGFNLSILVGEILPIVLSGSGLLLYMLYLQREFSDPLLFVHAQPAFGAQRSGDKLILLYQVFWRYFKMIITVDNRSLLYYSVVQELVSGFVFLVLSLVAFKRIRLSYAVFGCLSYILPTLTGTFSSMPRYVLLLFPSFMILGTHSNKLFKRLWWLVSAILLAINTALFIRGYWVA